MAGGLFSPNAIVHLVLLHPDIDPWPTIGLGEVTVNLDDHEHRGSQRIAAAQIISKRQH